MAARIRLASRALCVLAAAAFAFECRASWYWPFGSGEAKGGKARLSELMEAATAAIDNAADFAADGKTSEAIEEYRKALDELDRVERENPERAATGEFASVRNKRAYVNAAIDSLLMAQARENAKAVAVTDTTELERRFAERRAARQGVEAPAVKSQMKAFVDGERARSREVRRKASRAKAEGEIRELLEKDPSSRRARVMQAGLKMLDGDVAGAREALKSVLAESPDDVPALNMYAVCAASEGDYPEADESLSRAMKANPKDYRAYYNMANLMLQATGDKDVARRYYDAGRSAGGPEDKDMEASFR